MKYINLEIIQEMNSLIELFKKTKLIKHIIAILLFLFIIKINFINVNSSACLDVEKNLFNLYEIKINENTNNIHNNLLTANSDVINKANEMKNQEFNMLLGTWKICREKNQNR